MGRFRRSQTNWRIRIRPGRPTGVRRVHGFQRMGFFDPQSTHEGHPYPISVEMDANYSVRPRRR